ncbi:nucleotide exchange factor GrpE [Maribacter halichondriae]|uniref:nucleotide exchange factor GrpE n=1 Tax=Maribacter halichondriae TaxID=2980554 RepID=UPI002358B362|nr:nucleotide exchange factor GrpE [Maribacter sp. Hal144]
MSKKDKAEEIDEIGSETQENREASEQGEMHEEQHERTVEEELREELGKEKDKFLRLFAEFENYKRRTSKERMELFKTAGQEIMVSLLPVLDDFDRALKELSKADDDELLKGVKLIRGKFRETLNSKGLQEVGAEQGDVFDAEIHEAITQIPAPNKMLKGKIIDIIEKGYKLGDKIIRHPKVVVGN